MKRKVLLVMMVCSHALGSPGKVSQGVEQTFTYRDLMSNRAGHIVASSNYQVSLTLPVEIQSVTVNARMQQHLRPSIDESDGRVVYLDVLKPGGQATLTMRMVSKSGPKLLKFLVELSNQQSGVLTYTVQTQGTPSNLVKKIPSVMTQKVNGIRIDLKAIRKDEYAFQIYGLGQQISAQYNLKASLRTMQDGKLIIKELDIFPNIVHLGKVTKGRIEAKTKNQHPVLLFHFQPLKKHQKATYIGFKVAP